MANIRENIEKSRDKLHDYFSETRDITFLTGWGNIGDQLIFAGTRQLLAGSNYREQRIGDLHGVHGHTALITGSGGWCGPYHRIAKYLPVVEEHFEQVIVLPSSFDVNVAEVHSVLSKTRALVFAREEVSYKQIQSLCRAELAHDCAFFFDFRPYERQGHGILNAFRTDGEAIPFELPPNNNDLSLTCNDLNEWLWTIARHKEIRTDRAHIMIAAAMLGRRVFYRASSYHKLPAIAQYALEGACVHQFIERAVDNAEASRQEPLNHRDVKDQSPSWTETRQRFTDELSELIPPDCSYILVDQNRLGILPLAGRHAIPFLERGGRYWGPPPDDTSAIQELERLREAAPAYLVFAWPALWWLEHYSGFRTHLENHYHCMAKNECLVAFDLRKSNA